MVCENQRAAILRTGAESRRSHRNSGQTRDSILVVDDEEGIRFVLSRLLEFEGYRVITASDGLEGVHRFHEEENRIALILLDMIMPVMDGEEVMETIRMIRQDAKIIVISGYFESDVMRRIRDERHTAFLRKPFELPELMSEIGKLLNAN